MYAAAVAAATERRRIWCNPSHQAQPLRSLLMQHLLMRILAYCSSAKSR
jgi:hypothetical protein